MLAVKPAQCVSTHNSNCFACAKPKGATEPLHDTLAVGVGVGMVLIPLGLIRLVQACETVGATVLKSETAREVHFAVWLPDVVVALPVVPGVGLSSSI